MFYGCANVARCRIYVSSLSPDSRLSIVWNSSFQLTMNDFSVHRIIGRGGFGEVYGCRKADTGKM